MVSPSDIPCVGNIVDRISDATVSAMLRGLRYIFCYKALVDVLNSETVKLNSEKDEMSKKVKEETDNGKIIHTDILTWQNDVEKEVEEIQKSAKEFSPSWRCIQRLPVPNPFSRFRFGREAVKKTKTVTDLTGSGRTLLDKEIADFPEVENLPQTRTAFENFQSRSDAYEMVWQMLVNEDSPLVQGIYGMPGVGKTRMMEQIWKEAKEKNVFNKVTRADLGSEKLDVIKIQNQIAGHLDCHLKAEDDMHHRARQLQNSLVNAGKTLLILDDVWEEIPVDKIIGVSFGDASSAKGSKILLTSRSKNVCLHNKCKHPVEITTLRDDEALDLFKIMVGYGDSHVSRPDKTLVQKVCDECAGLPLLICAVGKALRYATKNEWTDALSRLKNCKIESVPGIGEKEYSCLKLSFDKLKEDAKTCLLLCSLFPEDASIHIRMLIVLATGSQFHVDGESVRGMVDVLKSSSLLLEGEDYEHFKLHDIIRDVARSVAVKDPNYTFFFGRCGSWMPYNADYAKWKVLHLDLEKNDFDFREDLVWENLHTLSLRSVAEPPKEDKRNWYGLPSITYIEKFSSGKFDTLQSLVLLNVFLLEQVSLQHLCQLRTLFLNSCDITETGVRLFPDKLETLSIWKCNLPRLILLPNLKYLEKLELRWCGSGDTFLPNTISRLSSLKELHLPDAFENSAYIGMVKPRLDEITELTRLTSLQIAFGEFELNQESPVWSNLTEFDISVGEYFSTSEFPKWPNLVSRVKVISKHISSGLGLKCMQNLIGRAEEVILDRTNIDLSSIGNDNKFAFADLRTLYINHCNKLKHLPTIPQDEIQVCQTSFSKLTYLFICDCSNMEYLFTNSVAKSLMQLQKLYIYKCYFMKAIILSEGTCEGEDIINFSKLMSLKLYGLSKLRGFYWERNVFIRQQPLFDERVAFPSLEELELSYIHDNFGDIWGEHHYNDDNLSSFRKLKSLTITGCEQLETVIPKSMLHRLQSLEYLNISSCQRLRNVFLPCIARDLIHLKEMCVHSCPGMKEIIGEGVEEATDAIVFPQLTLLKLTNLHLTSFWCLPEGKANTYQVEFPNIVDFKLSLGEDTSLVSASDLNQGENYLDLNEHIRDYYEE